MCRVVLKGVEGCVGAVCGVVKGVSELCVEDVLKLCLEL